ncbi:transmembrane protein PVRIG isoform X1 [Meriones unguiculatus]|uniref:transmembrane protein PVRIG isoform X1 n=1 Tax=Meriones unguiculatus TaxID=10047 RepID=UPI00293E70D4|nr:transmembrane protein PVRIG isoform X1 [Meriones unguiculatus]
MAQAEALVLFSSLLTLCVSTGSPEVWVQVQRGPTELPSFLVRCGVSTSSPISLVTVSREGFVDAGGTKLAVLHPEHGSQEWAPTSQARWETSNSIALTVTLEQSEQSLDNATFCCEFVTFPLGVRAACGDLHGSEPGMSAARRETGRTWPPAAHLIPFCVLDSLPQLQPPSFKQSWPGSWEPWGSFCLVLSSYCVSCAVGRGAGVSVALSHPSPAPRHGRRLSFPAWPLHAAAASSPLRTDCMPRHERNLPTPFRSRHPLTVWSTESQNDAWEFYDRHPRPSTSLGTSAAAVFILGARPLHESCFLFRPLKSVIKPC